MTQSTVLLSFQLSFDWFQDTHGLCRLTAKLSCVRKMAGGRQYKIKPFNFVKFGLNMREIEVIKNEKFVRS